MAASCPQCDGPLRTVDRARLDCPRCGAVVWLDGRPTRSPRALPFAVGGLGAGLAAGVGLTTLVLGGPLGAPASDPPVVPELTTPRTVHAPPEAVRAPASPAVPAVMSPEPEYLESAEAMAALPARIAAVTDRFTGRFRFLAVDRIPVAVALVEVGPAPQDDGAGMSGVDSVVFSWGARVLDTVPLSAEERERLPNELFTLTPAQLARVPALVDQVMASSPEESSVERVTIHGLAGPPRIEVERSHPRLTLDPVRFDLDGRPL